MSFLATVTMALSLMQGVDTLGVATAEAQMATTPTETVQATRRLSFHEAWRRILPGKTQQPLTVYRGDLIKRQKWVQDGWVIEVRKDGFANQIQCRIRPQQLIFSPARVTYADGVMGFRFKGNADPAKTWFRVDDQAARPWRDMFRELHARGMTVRSYNLDYRDDTVILIPIEELQGASTVAIRASEKGKPDVFDVTGFSSALEASQRVGCTQDSFVREQFR